jgi:hypothetical protein
VSFTDLVNHTDPSDFYRFDLATTGAVNIALKGLASNADLRLVQDLNDNSAIDAGEILASSASAGTSNEQILIFLGAGTYFVEVADSSQGSSPSTNSSGGYTLELTSDLAGATLPAARELGVITKDLALVDFLSKGDTSDFYRFNLSKTASVTVEMSSGDDDVILELIRDANNNRIIDPGEVIASSVAESKNKTVNARLESGEYFVRVASNDDDENYQLRLISDLDDNLTSAREVGSLQGRVSFTDLVGGSDPSDFYRFDMPITGAVNIALNRLGSNVDLRLIQDVNNNGAVDEGEILASSNNSSTNSEQIVVVLGPGTYFVEAVGLSESLFSSGGGGYTLELTSDLAGGTLRTARDLGALATDLALVDFLGENDASDFYRFSLPETASVTVNFASRHDEFFLELIRDANNNGIIDPGELVVRSESDPNITLSASLEAGTYFVHVTGDDDDHNYELRLSL